MKLHEYQSKEIFKKFDVSVPAGVLVATIGELEAAIEAVPGPPWVIKAQVHAGGRGKGGGVTIAGSREEAHRTAEAMLGGRLVTAQTGPQGVVVHQILVEEGVDIARELYLGMVMDRAEACPVMILSQAGGMEIEEVAARTPQLIMRAPVDPIVGFMPYLGRKMIYALEPVPQPDSVRALIRVMQKLHGIFVTHDCSLVEINPLAICNGGTVVALDAKMDIDDNALFRQKELAKLDDPRERDPLELMARQHGLNYIRLDGNIGAMVNGAGLAMATMDVIKLAGAEPANFLDVGGGASEEMITKGFEIILKDPRVQAVLINIFGGILRCDVLARGVLEAAKKIDIQVPLIVRLEGTNVEEGRRILEDSGLQFLVARDMAEAAQLVAKQVSGTKGS